MLGTERTFLNLRSVAFVSACGVSAAYWIHPLIVPMGLALSLILLVLSGRSPALTPSRLATGAILHLYVAAVAFPAVLMDPATTWARVIGVPLLCTWWAAFLRPTPIEAIVLVKAVGIGSVLAAVLMYVQSGPFDIDVSLAYLLTRNRADGYYLLDRFYQGAPSISGPAGIGLVCANVGIANSSGARRAAFSLLSIVGLTILLLTVSRGSLIAASAAALVLAAFYTFHNFAIGRLGWAFATIAVAATTVAVVLELALENIPAAALRYETMFGGPSQDASLSERLTVWTHYVDLAIRQPFGHGFSYTQSSVALMDYSTHNEILGQWVSAGIAGLIAYGMVLIRWGGNVVGVFRGSAPPQHAAATAGLSVLVFFLAAGITENYSVSSGSLLFIAFWVLAVTLMFTERLHPAMRSPADARSFQT